MKQQKYLEGLIPYVIELESLIPRESSLPKNIEKLYKTFKMNHGALLYLRRQSFKNSTISIEAVQLDLASKLYVRRTSHYRPVQGTIIPAVNTAGT